MFATGNGGYYFSTSSTDISRSPEVKLQYGKSVKNRFKALIWIWILITGPSLAFNLFHAGWYALMLIGLTVTILYYRYRITRTVTVSGQGISETVAGRTWIWKYDEIGDVTEWVTRRPEAEPSRRLVIEHVSSLDVIIDDQMDGYLDALELIGSHWDPNRTGRIRRKAVGFFLLKYV